jgi:hypothetical protein
VEALKQAKAKGIENCKVRRTGLLVNGHLIPACELCDSSWVDNLAWLSQEGPGERGPPRVPGEKRSHDALRSPSFADVAGFFPAARNNQQSTTTNAAGTRGRGRGRPKGTKAAKTN